MGTNDQTDNTVKTDKVSDDASKVVPTITVSVKTSDKPIPVIVENGKASDDTKTASTGKVSDDTKTSSTAKVSDDKTNSTIEDHAEKSSKVESKVSDDAGKVFTDNKVSDDLVKVVSAKVVNDENTSRPTTQKHS